MVKIKEIEIITKSEFQLIKITEHVRKFVSECGIKNGIVLVLTSHTTTGIMVNESLDCLEIDIEEALERLIPKHAPYAHSHFLPSYGTTGGNAPGHLKSMLAGNHCIFPVIDGEMVFGHAQDIYFAEFDGQLKRKFFIEVMGE